MNGTLQRHRRTYTLGGSRLQLGRSLRHGEISTPSGTWPVRVTSFHRLAVTAGDVVVLHRDAASVPDGPARWEVSRRSVSVARADGARIVVREEGFFRKTTTVQVGGVWAEPDLVVLTACFALVARQRRRQAIMIMAAANNHGGTN